MLKSFSYFTLKRILFLFDLGKETLFKVSVSIFQGHNLKIFILIFSRKKKEIALQNIFLAVSLAVWILMLCKILTSCII